MVGATGMLGRDVLAVVEERELPLSRLVLFGSGEEEVGESLRFRGSAHRVEQVDSTSIEELDAVIFAGGPNTSRQYARVVSEAGGLAIDATGGFSWDEEVPIVLAGMNDHVQAMWGRIVACPRPAAAILARVLKPLREIAGSLRVVVSTYQAVSDAGEVAIEEFSSQIMALFRGEATSREILPKSIAFNCIPQVGAFLPGGQCEEEALIAMECRYLLGAPDLSIEVMAAFVPVFSGDSLAISVETEGEIPIDRVREVLSGEPGVELIDDPTREEYPINMEATGKSSVLVGRIRAATSLPAGRGFSLWAAGDNVRVSALGAVQIVEVLASRLEDA